MSSGLKPLIAAAWLVMVLIAGSLLVGGRDVLIPLALAVLIWQLINAIAGRYKKLGLRGKIADGGLRLALAVLTIIVALAFVVDLIVTNIGAVSAAAPIYEANLLALLPRIADLFGLPHPPTATQLLQQIDLDRWIRSLSATLAAFVANLGLVALYVAFMLFEQQTFDRKIDALFPDPARAASFRTLLLNIEGRIRRYLWIKTVLSIANGFLSWMVLFSVGCEYAGFWALFIFMLNYIPTIGSIFGVAFPALLTLVQFGSFGPFLVGLGIIQIGISNVIEPRLMGHTLNLSPVVIIVSLTVWGSLWGIAGLFLCVPIMVIVMIVCAHMTATRPVAILLSGSGNLEAKEVQDAPRPGGRV